MTFRLRVVPEANDVPSQEDDGESFASPVVDEMEGTLRPLEEATMLPQRCYVDPEVFAFENTRWFRTDWVCVGRVSDVGVVGQWFTANVGGASVLLVRGDDHELRAFHNVCRHRGSTLFEGRGYAPRIRCPYHSWSYDLSGRLVRAPGMQQVPSFDPNDHALGAVRLETFGGFLFVSLAAEGQSLMGWLNDLPAQFDGILLDHLVVGQRTDRVVHANWKLLMENFAESYHFRSVHPRLQSQTPSDRAESLLSIGPWQGGWMPLRPGAETVSRDGKRHGRPLLRTTGAPMNGALDYVLFPNLFLSLQPDYLLAYRLTPTSHAETRVTLDVLFDRRAVKDGARETVEASDVYEFWEETNAEDYAICERQQIGIASPGFRPGRYAPAEEGTYEFDKIVAQRHAER
jgi:glycine betaine catabolism A